MSSEQDYSPLDRAIHRLAFANWSVQLAAADIEGYLYGKRFRNVRVEKPVFITSLPRAGTTLFLEIFGRLPGFATHRYRDMPFVLAPILWDSLSRSFRKRSNMKERAHRDGMAVGYDSPEAFEEVVWRAFWPEKYKQDRIVPWRENERNVEFEHFLVEHLQKIITVRSTEAFGPRRYVSKNNANIARIGLIRRLFPDSFILVPFRQPIDHAASMFRQHKNFLALHGREPFSRKYMHDIGHFEFGWLHRPISMGRESNQKLHRYRVDTLDYWLAYWIVAFEHILRNQNEVILFSYGVACEDGGATLEAIGAHLEIEFDEAPSSMAKMFKSPNRYRTDVEVQNRDLLNEAQRLHKRLLGISIASRRK